MRALIFLWGVSLIPSVVWAQDTLNSAGTGCTIIPVEGQTHTAEVHCTNVETVGSAYEEGALTVGDLTLGLTISHGPGKIPDTFTLFPPEGYVVVPDQMTLDENTRGVALVYPFLGM